jgi:hypothetical protein
MNLANAAVAACGPGDDLGDLMRIVWAEGEACLAAAGIDVATRAEDKERRGDLLTIKPIDGADRHGGSSWQSLARGTGTIETDYLTGEIVLLGRLPGFLLRKVTYSFLSKSFFLKGALLIMSSISFSVLTITSTSCPNEFRIIWLTPFAITLLPFLMDSKMTFPLCI